MKKLISLFLFLGIMAGVVHATMTPGKQDVVGEWKYEVTSAPYGYEKGVITFTAGKDALEGEVKFDSGYKIKLKTVVIEGENLKLDLYVENTYISVIAKITGEKMEGTVDSSQGKMALKAERKQK